MRDYERLLFVIICLQFQLGEQEKDQDWLSVSGIKRTFDKSSLFTHQSQWLALIGCREDYPNIEFELLPVDHNIDLV